MDLPANLPELLFNYGCIKFGDFVLSSGGRSPYYIDLRGLIAKPKVLKEIARLVQVECLYTHDVVCGVPYGGIAYAVAYSVNYDKPLILTRQEVKKHGTARIIEGNPPKGARVLVIEDVITTGASLEKELKKLETAGLTISSVVAIVDRCQGGVESLRAQGYKIQTLTTVREIFSELYAMQNITNTQYTALSKYLGQFKLETPRVLEAPFARKLWELMQQKGTNLIVALDIPDGAKVREIIKQTQDSVLMYKIHVEIFSQWPADLLDSLQVPILLDRKFSDIGNTVKMQLEALPVRGTAATCHAFSAALLNAVSESDYGIFVISDMSHAHWFPGESYRQEAYSRSRNIPVAGFVTQKRDDNWSDEFFYLTPGVRLGNCSSDQLDQKYRTVEQAIVRDKCDIIIVGRGITGADNPGETAQQYRQEAWKYFLEKSTSKKQATDGHSN